MRSPYQPKGIPVETLAWESLIPRIGMAQAAVARFDGILQVHAQGSGRRPTIFGFRRLIAITEGKEFG